MNFFPIESPVWNKAGKSSKQMQMDDGESNSTAVDTLTKVIIVSLFCHSHKFVNCDNVFIPIIRN